MQNANSYSRCCHGQRFKISENVRASQSDARLVVSARLFARVRRRLLHGLQDAIEVIGLRRL